MRVEQFLEDSARRLPEKVALIEGETRLTYRALDEAATGLAAGLEARGVGRGDRVVIFADNCWEAVVGLFGVLKAGGVFCMVNPSTKPDKLRFILNDCQAVAVVTLGRLLPAAREALAGAPSVAAVIVAGESGDLDAPRETPFAEAIASGAFPTRFRGIECDLAMLVYTSGSTGFPKGVMMTHQNVVAAATSITTYLENTEDDVILNVLPISFDYGLYQVLMAAKVGATLALEKSFAFPQLIFDRIRQERVTGFPIVPTIAALMLQMRDLAPGALPSLRYISNTAAALPPAHILRLQELFPTTSLFSMYGLTECKRCTYLPPGELQSRPASVGVAIPGTEAYVVDDDANRVPPRVVGELVIRGPHVMKGYWGNPEATAKALRPGPYPWEKVLHTGDLFYADEEGFLYFVGRKDDIIKTRGEKVSPKEVENVLFQLEGVKEAVVIGVPDAVLGAALKAVIAVAPGVSLTERDVIRHCARRLEDFMVPKFVTFRAELPKTDSGKISRRETARLMEVHG
ncbi:class I adenylate-forming enzyme family protein [Rhodoblastus sp.]|uniref:class I adenylate-forming enzyme family protein n=2 Tax=Rhodoblastus sp. TaxID=1962975 RepID=UPI003F94507E